MIDISVIIVNYKSWDSLQVCLESIQNIESSRFTVETIVVDNCSNDNQIDRFIEQYSFVNFILNSGNNGFANGCNTGANHAQGAFFLFLNPDTVANESAIFELWNEAKTNPDAGIVSCSQINENRRAYKEVRFFPSLKTLFGVFRAIYMLLLKKNISKNFNPTTKKVFPEWTTGAVIFMSRVWFDSINGWNEKFWLYLEDVDICKKVTNNGGKIVLLRTSQIIHKHGGASRVNIKTKALTKAEVLISKHVYFNEHAKGIVHLIIQILLVVTILVEKTVLAIIGGVFFFLPKIRVHVYIFLNMIVYYSSALYHFTWISTRSIAYKK
jgi:GT2 family glycosyltransferase